MTDKAIEALALVKLRLSEIDGTYDWSAEIATIRAALEAKAEPVTPIPAILHCTHCNQPHVDEGEWATRPHKTHQCQHCGHEWRPYPVPTVGIAPPTTAEVKAQALEEAGRDMVEHFKEQRLDMTMALAVQEGLRQRAEKLREKV